VLKDLILLEMKAFTNSKIVLRASSGYLYALNSVMPFGTDTFIRLTSPFISKVNSMNAIYSVVEQSCKF
jgi:hypothetical protein